MIYLKNNNTVYPLNKELRIISDKMYHLMIGENSIMGSPDMDEIKFYFNEIQKQISEGNKLINFNALIGSYKKKDS